VIKIDEWLNHFCRMLIEIPLYIPLIAKVQLKKKGNIKMDITKTDNQNEENKR